MQKKPVISSSLLLKKGRVLQICTFPYVGNNRRLFGDLIWIPSILCPILSRLVHIYITTKNTTSIVILSLLLFLTSCANPIAPTGGPKDETPPSVVEEKSTLNFQTNFKPHTIELTFDEWIKIQNANEQVIISPPFDGYKVRLKGKTLVFDFGDKDTLRDNVTYVIQFGETVKDLTESNPAEDLRFVFSTGSQIDSLGISGNVIDAYTSEPVEKALVLLYENLADSVFRTERPFYFGRTNDAGRFSISNMRAGTYKVCALLDADANYKFSQINEPIAFLTDPIVVSNDTSHNLTLELFTEKTPLQLLDVDSSSAGVVKLIFNQASEQSLQLEAQTDFLAAFEKDTTFIWHTADTIWTLFLSSDTVFYDTIKMQISNGGIDFKNIQLRHLPGENRNPYPRRIFVLGMSSPISSLDTSMIRMLADSSELALPFDWKIDSLDARRLLINYPFKENTHYTWTALPGGVINLWNQTNIDTLNLEWVSSDRKKFGNIRIQFSADSEDNAYYIKLLQKGKNPIITYRLQGALSYERNITGIPPGDYQLEIIQDDNGNGRWDTGSYDGHQQAEKITIRPIEKLRANWDLDVDVELKVQKIE